MVTDKSIQAAVRDAKENAKANAKAIAKAEKAGEKAELSAEGEWLSDGARGRGAGTLQFRATAGGEVFAYFRYVDSKGKQDRLRVGAYDPRGVDGLTLRQARDKAGEWSKLYQDGRRDLRAFVEHQRAEERGTIEAAKREREQAERQAKSGTVRALFLGYIEHLERQGKRSAGDVRNIVRRNVFDEFPHLAEMRAAAFTHRDASMVLAKLIDRGAGRTAGKLRAYGRAAWAAAISAESDPTVPAALHGFELSANAWAAVPAKPLAAFNRARTRTLSESEMHAFLAEISKRPGFHSDAILLHLLTGGQRSEQLLRLRRADVDLDASTIRLFDGKGNRQQPREHVLPLTDRAASIIELLMAAHPDSEHVFTSHGRVPVRSETISQAVVEICDAMIKAKSARERFDLRDLRRTTETMLAKMGISRDVRAQILSHGLSGVQQRHYDKHDYAEEKRNGLEAWDAKLQAIARGEVQDASGRRKVVDLSEARA